MSFWSTVEAKVKSAAVATFLAGLLLAILNATVANSQLMGGFPAWLQFVLVTFGPALAAFLSGYATRHTAKPPVVARMHRP